MFIQNSGSPGPSITFLDEMDALLSNRKSDEHKASRRLETEFMTQIDGLGWSIGGVLLLA
jgi:SpoVK/Ycf46/Vps4 family AAA+-type ATPase